MWNMLNRAAETPIGKLFSQLVIISLGGLAITHTYNYYTEEREKRAEKRQDQTARYLTLRKDLFDMHQERYLALIRLIRIISRNDASYARRFYENQFEKSVDGWNRNLNRYYAAFWLGPLAKSADCLDKLGVTKDQFSDMFVSYNAFHSKGEGTSAEAKEIEKVLADAHKECARYLFVGIDAFEEELGKSDGFYKAPASLHYAYRNSSTRIRGIFGSDWERCFERADKVAEIEMQKCFGDGSDPVTCVSQVYKTESDLKTNCKKKISSQIDALVKDRKLIKQKWNALHRLLRPAP